MKKMKIKDMEFEEVITGLLGSCNPYGDTSIDEERLKNLKMKEELVYCLVDEIITTSEYWNRKEYSIKELADTAYDFLEDLNEKINYCLEVRKENGEEK